MSNSSSQLNTDNLAARLSLGYIDHSTLPSEIEKARQRMLLYGEILQFIRQSDDLEEIFATITAKLLKSLHAIHVSIYKLDKLDNKKSIDINREIEVTGRFVAESKANSCEPCSQIQIKNILLENYQLGESAIVKTIDRYTAGITQCDLNLAEIFAGKAYVLVPIVLPELDRNQPLWGFLTVHQCTAVEYGATQSRWDQDDVLMLQQIAMQIEIILQRGDREDRLLKQVEEADQAYIVLYRWTQQYRSLVEQIPSVSYVSPIANTPEFAYISPQIQDLLGIIASEWNAGFFNAWAAYVHPDDRDRVQQEVQRSIETGEPFCSEYRMINREGKIIWVRDTARIGLATDGETQVLRGSAFDISDRKEIELRFKGIFNNTFQFVGLLSTDGIFLEVNQTALDFGGFTRADVVGQKIWDTPWLSLSKDTQNRVKQSVQQAAQGEFIRYEIDIIGVDRKIITIDFSIRPVKDESGQITLLIPEGRDISELKTIEKSLRKSEAMLAKAQKIAKIGNWEWDILSNEIIWSEELFHIFGRDLDLGDPTYEEILELHVSEDRQKLDQAVQRTVNTGESYHLELRLSQGENSYRYVEAIGHAEYDDHGQVIKLYGTAQDISDRKAVESKLRHNKTLLNLTIENASVGIATMDLEGKFLNVNQSFCKIYGYSSAELLNMSAFEITHPNSINKTVEALEALVNGTSTNIRIEKQYIHKDGHIIDAISWISLMKDEEGNPLQIITNVEDVTERKQTEAKLEAARLAEASNQAKSEFLAVMSHELRTPMNAVIGMTGLLLDTPLSSQQQQYVSTIRQGGEVLLSVINNILDFSRIESGHFEIEEHPFKLRQCIDEVLDLMTSRIAEKSLELFGLIHVDVPQQILGDYNRLRQILVNLISNAIKFTDIGEIVVTVTSQLIDPETNTRDLLFNIRDTGIGIAPEAISKLFQAFRQADSSINRKYGGTGLGLAICKQLCELMGGEIDVESTIGEGSNFHFSIRVKEIATEPMAIASELKGKRILSVNTNVTCQQAIALYIQPWQMTVQSANSATQALQCLTEYDFDLVLIDRYLSDVNSLELAKNIQDVLPELNLVLLTSAKESLMPIPVSFSSTIIKPITESKLYQACINIFTNQNSTPIQSLNLSLLNENFAKQHPFQILVVEDNPINQQILLLILEKLGYIGKLVDNGLEAIQALENQFYDLIIMDIQMPIMDGLTTTKNIRQKSDQHPWIIGLSANAFTESCDLALLAGMNDYLTKPLQVEDLVNALQRATTKSESTRLAFTSSNLTSAASISLKSPSVDFRQSSLNLETISNLEKMAGKQLLSTLISEYLEHSAQAIGNIKEALKTKDIIVIEAENHTLKGGSGTFGAINLCNYCKELQSLCHQIHINHHPPSTKEVEMLEHLVYSIEQEYNHVFQAFQSIITPIL